MSTTIGSVGAADNLKGKLFRGGAWLGVGSLTEQVFRFGRNIVLTRLLAPEAFGTMAIILSAASVIQSLTEVGAKEALIQNQNGDQEHYIGAAWWLAFGRSVSVYLMLFMAAPFIATFYGNPQFTALLRVATLGIIFEGAISTNAYVAMKQMRFRRWAVINHGGAVLGVVITLILSLLFRNVWALVLGAFSESVAKCILSYIVCPFLPPLGWHPTAIRDLLRFSKGVFGLPFLNLIFIRADVFVLGKLYSPTELGLYAMAIYLVQTPASFVINLLGQTLMPTFSHLQEDQSRVNRILLLVTTAIFILGMPVLVFLFFSGRSLLTLVYGNRYGAASAALVVASCVALFNTANAQITTVFYAKGFPQLHRRAVAVMAILMVFLIYPLARYFGIVGGQLACLIAVLAGYLFQIERIRKVTGLDLPQYRKTFLVAGLISLSGLTLCLLGKSFGGFAQPVYTVFLGAFGCFVTYGLAYLLIFRRWRDTSSALGL
jgi:O-antigen/teichoic acid export membrane protein